MQTPVAIAFRYCEPSEEIRSEIAAQVQRLEKFSPRITSCRVVVNGPQSRHRRGDLFQVELRIAMPEHKDETAQLPTPTRLINASLTIIRKWDCLRAAWEDDRPWPTRRAPIADVVPQPANGPL